MRELLCVAAGGVVFTTLHQFFPEQKGDRHPRFSGRRWMRCASTATCSNTSYRPCRAHFTRFASGVIVPCGAAARIANAYHAWRGEKIIPSPSMGEGEGGGEYKDIAGFCKSATLEDIRKHGHVLTPGRYVGAEAQEDDGEPFEEKMRRLAGQLNEQLAEGARLDQAIRANLAALGFPLEKQP